MYFCLIYNYELIFCVCTITEKCVKDSWYEKNGMLTIDMVYLAFVNCQLFTLMLGDILSFVS